MEELNLDFNHNKLKTEMIELLNQFEYVDKSFKGDVAFAKPEHSRHLRKIYNKMNDILNTHYKNLPKEYETYNKNTPKEDKPKKQTKNTKNTKNKKSTLEGGEYTETSKSDIFKKMSQKITPTSNNDNNTLSNISDDSDDSDNYINKKIIGEIKKKNNFLSEYYYPDKKYEHNSVKIILSKINSLIDLINNNFNSIDNECKNIKKDWELEKQRIKSKYNC